MLQFADLSITKGLRKCGETLEEISKRRHGMIVSHNSCFYSNHAGTSRQTPGLGSDDRDAVRRLCLFQQNRPAAARLRKIRPQMQQAARPLPREDENKSAPHSEVRTVGTERDERARRLTTISQLFGSNTAGARQLAVAAR